MIVCYTCNKSVFGVRGKRRRSKRRFCSIPCYRVWQRGGNYSPPLCEVCFQAIPGKPYRAKKARTCSRNCWQKLPRDKRTEEVRQKVSIGRRKHLANHDPDCTCLSGAFKPGAVPWLKGLTKETDTRVAKWAKKLKGRNFSAEHRARLGEAMVVRLTNGWPSPTNLEWALQLLLEDAGFDFETQKRFGRYAADMWVSSHALVFEADGSFWHKQREKKYPGYHAKRDAFLLSKGVKAVIHLTEYDLDPWLEA